MLVDISWGGVEKHFLLVGRPLLRKEPHQHGRGDQAHGQKAEPAVEKGCAVKGWPWRPKPVHHLPASVQLVQENKAHGTCHDSEAKDEAFKDVLVIYFPLKTKVIAI